VASSTALSGLYRHSALVLAGLEDKT
jgi:hypothetical protein